MPDLSTVYLPPFPELSVDVAGGLVGNRAEDAAAAPASDAAAPESASSGDGSGVGDGAPVLPVECRWSGRVRTFDVAGAGTVAACPAAHLSGWKKSSSAAVAAPGRTLEEHMKEWAARKAAAGVPAQHCELPFLTGATKAIGHGKIKLVCSRCGVRKKSSSVPSHLSVATPAPALAQTFAEHVKEWVVRKVAAGVPVRHCVLPFLTGTPKAVECRLCSKIIYPGEEIQCSVSRCREMFHLTCAVKDNANLTVESFKCPQHGCMVCKQKMFFWRCGRCTVAAHTKCAPWPLIHLKDDQGSAICWRHPADWLLQNENADPTNNIEEVFCRLPLPYVNEDFNIDSTIRDFTAIVYKPPPYTLIRRNVYLIKKKRADSRAEAGCTNCSAASTCKDDCECRGLSMSCSKNCRCSDLCTNKPFRKDKKIKIVKTKRCGWGAVALELLEKGDFIIEYVGEVINDATCEQRLWDMKQRGDQNFYMCEISKDFTIDATFKGNTSRFLNHSCDPNCKLEKWQVDGETRVGVFASRFIDVGEPLTYDYRFVHFGEKVKCYCRANNCQGYLGSQLKNPTQNSLATAALEGQVHKSLTTHQGSSVPRFKPMTHLLPWTNCIEVPFNLRSKRKINRLCWGRKRKRTSIAGPSSTSIQTSVTEAAASFP